MEDSYSQHDNIWNRLSRHTSQEGKVFKAANKRTQEPTLASRMDRVVSICCMRRDMLASFCRKEDKMSDILMSFCNSHGATDIKIMAKIWRKEINKPLHKLWKNG